MGDVWMWAVWRRRRRIDGRKKERASAAFNRRTDGGQKKNKKREKDEKKQGNEGRSKIAFPVERIDRRDATNAWLRCCAWKKKLACSPLFPPWCHHRFQPLVQEYTLACISNILLLQKGRVDLMNWVRSYRPLKRDEGSKWAFEFESRRWVE